MKVVTRRRKPSGRYPKPLGLMKRVDGVYIRGGKRLRKDWDSYFLDIAYMVASRSTCPRRSVGAVVVKDRRIKSTGYNGSAAGLPHCTDEGCLIINDHCVRTIHAEVNALLECSPDERNGATIYITDRPCAECSKLIVSSGIKKVIFGRDYHLDFDWFSLAPWVEIIHLTTETQVKKLG